VSSCASLPGACDAKERPTWVRADDLPAAPDRGASAALQRVFAGEDRLRALGTNAALLEEVLRAAEPATPRAGRRLVRQVTRIFVDRVQGFSARRAAPQEAQDGKTGAATVVQRTSSDLRLNPCCAAWRPACRRRACIPSTTPACSRRPARGESAFLRKRPSRRRRPLSRRPRRWASRAGPNTKTPIVRGWCSWRAPSRWTSSPAPGARGG